MVGESRLSDFYYRWLGGALPILFGCAGLPLMVMVHDTWLLPWSDFGAETDVLILFGYLAPIGFAFWYLSGFVWGAPVGCFGPAVGVLFWFVVGLSGSVPGDNPLTDATWGAVMAALAGILAYPFGLLARSAFVVRAPLLGLAWGALLVVLGCLAIATAPEPGLFLTIDPGTWFAAAMLLAGAGTLVVVLPAARATATASG